MTKERYEFLPHPSELKIRCYGDDLPDIFINAALAMEEYIFGKKLTHCDQYQTLEVLGEDVESLLVNWLSEILYLNAVKKCVYQKIVFKEFSTKKILAEVGGVAAKAIQEIKAITYNELQILQVKHQYIATVVCDI